MSITIIGGNISNNGGDGIRTSGEVDLIIDGTTIANNARRGINIGNFDQNIDEETKELLYELKNALNNKDSINVKRIFAAIVDKSIDIAIAVATGLIFK